MPNSEIMTPDTRQQPQEPQVTTEEFNEFLAVNLPFCTTMGLRAHDVKFGEGTMRWVYDDAYTRPPDFVCGPIMMALADASLYLALFTVVGIEPNALTNELKTNFLRPARGQDLLATARVIKNGRRVMYGAVDIAEASDTTRLVAHATGSYVRPD